MKKRILFRILLGILLGAAMMYIVPPLLNHGHINRAIYSGALLARVGSPAKASLLTLLVMGLFGALCVGGTLFYEVERWPLALATAVHYLSISLGYLVVDRLLCWEMPLRLLLFIEGGMTVGFFLIWLSIYLCYKAQVRELNELMEKKNELDGEERSE